MYGPTVLGASTTTTAALVLPSTHAHKWLEAVVAGVLFVAIVVTIVGVAKILASRAAHKA